MNFEKNLESNIQIEPILLTDDFALVIDKINQNFREVKVSSSYSSVERGRVGLIGARGKEGPSDESFRSLLKFYNSIGSNETFTSDKESTITNRRVDITFLLSDLFGDSLSTLDVYTDTSKFTTDYSPENYRDYRLKILASDKVNSKGRHIYLSNSSNVKKSKEFLKKSGFTVNIDANKNNNTEEFSVTFQKNVFIPNHIGKYNFTGDNVTFKKNDSYSSFIVEVESEPDYTKEHFVKLNVIKSSNSDVLINTVPYSGHIGLWNDLNGNETEDFIRIDSENLLLPFIRVKSLLNEDTDLYYTYQNYLRLRDDSYIQFKRLGKLWFIEYYIILQKEQAAPVDFFVSNFRIDIARTIGACLSSYESTNSIYKLGTTLSNFNLNSEFSQYVSTLNVNAQPNGFNKINDSFSLYCSINDNPTNVNNYFSANNNSIFFSGSLTAQNIVTDDEYKGITPIEILPFEYVP
jgi:hypothetical protein